MAIEFLCPHCGKSLKTSDDKAGISAACPDCQGRLTIPDATQVEAMGSPQAVDVFGTGLSDDEDGTADMKNCPMCGKSIRAVAKVCRYCGERLATAADSKSVVPTAVDSSDVLNTSISIFKEHWLPASLAFLIYFLIPLLVGYALNFGLIFGMLLLNQGRPPGGPEQFWIMQGLTQLISLIQMVLSLYLNLGLHLFMLNLARGRSPDYGLVFQGGRFFLRGLGASVVYALLVLGILVIFMVPAGLIYLATQSPEASLIGAGVGGLVYAVIAIYIGLRLFPYLVYLVDQDCGAMDCLRGAWAITAPNLGPAFIIGFLMALAGLMGFLACCLPGFATMGLFHLTVVVCYLMMCGRQVVVVE